METLTVLFIEDDRIVRQAWRRELLYRRPDVLILEAESLREVMQLIVDGNKFDGALVDGMLKEEPDGPAVVSYLRATPETMKVILVAASSASSSNKEMIDAGANGTSNSKYQAVSVLLDLLAHGAQ